MDDCLLAEAQHSARLLTVRKRGTTRFQLPGGKPETGEDALAAALRETAEEIGVDLPRAEIRPLGHWLGAAANDDADLVSAEVFIISAARLGRQQPRALAEIAELRWVSADTMDTELLAPLIQAFVLPAASAQLS